MEHFRNEHVKTQSFNIVTDSRADNPLGVGVVVHWLALNLTHRAVRAQPFPGLVSGTISRLFPKPPDGSPQPFT